MYVYVLIGVTLAVLLNSSGVHGRMGSEGRRGEVNPLPAWNTAPPSLVTYRNKGDTGDVDPRGSVRYNIAPNGRIMRGVITKHREIPYDDNGGGIVQATEECCYPDEY